MQSMFSPTTLMGHQVSAITRHFLSRSSTFGSAVMESVDVLRARLLYQSKKRGIRENDILIGGFAEQHLATMDRHALEQYDRIINGQHSEWDLFYYFSGAKEVPAELGENAVFQRMRQHFMAKQEGKDERMLSLERKADQILEERRLRDQRRAQGIMYDEEVLDGRVVQFNYAGEFCEQRGIGEIHNQLRRFMIGCALLGAVAFAFVKFDLNKKRRRKMWERQVKLYEARKNALKHEKQLAAA